jgi:hypothetical protein
LFYPSEGTDFFWYSLANIAQPHVCPRPFGDGWIVRRFLIYSPKPKEKRKNYSDRSSINGLHPVLSIFGESSLNIKVDKRWIPFVRNWIYNFTEVQYIQKPQFIYN